MKFEDLTLLHSWKKYLHKCTCNTCMFLIDMMQNTEFITLPVFSVTQMWHSIVNNISLWSQIHFASWNIRSCPRISEVSFAENYRKISSYFWLAYSIPHCNHHLTLINSNISRYSYIICSQGIHFWSILIFKCWHKLIWDIQSPHLHEIPFYDLWVRNWPPERTVWGTLNCW